MPNNNDLGHRLAPSEIQSTEPKPIFFNLKETADQDRLNELLDKEPQTKVVDTYHGQLLELFVYDRPWLHLNHPQRDKEFEPWQAEHYDQNEKWQAGTWVYLPWRHIILHLLPDADYLKIRTSRNRNLITAEEQTKYYNSTVGIAGLSVGNSCALGIVQTGGGKHLHLADMDTLELTNLNRIRGSIAELTEPKVYMTARQIYELDPYADLTIFTDGLTEDNIAAFMEGLDVVVDEIDNIGMKVRIRQEAKKRKLPIVMAADNGDGGVLDIERHDTDDNVDLFHGRAGTDIADRVLGQKLPLPVIGQIITEDLIGADVVSPRMKQSLLEIGKSLPTWPQLGGAATLNGSIVAATVRRILIDQPVIDNRAILSPEEWLTPGYLEPDQVAQRKKDTEQFLTTFHERMAQAPKPE